MVLTFDKLLYPVKLGTCKHVLMTTYPQKDPDTQKNTTEMNFIALVRNHTDGTKIIVLLVEEHVIELEKIGDNIKIQVDDTSIQLSQYNGYQLRENGETLLELNKLPDGSIETILSKSDIKILFDGERIQLMVSKNVKQTGNGCIRKCRLNVSDATESSSVLV